MTDYRAINAVNWSSLKALRKSPLQYQHDREHPREATQAMRIGSLIHAMLLEPETVDERFAVWSGTRRGNAWEQFRDEHPHQEIVTEAEMERAANAAAAVVQHPLAWKYLSAGDPEQGVTWTDPETGLRCKARTDLVNGKLVELKSTADVTPRRFAQTAAQLGYHGQLAFYLDGIRLAGHDVAPEPVLIVVESDEPHDVAVYRVPEHEVEAGRHLYRRLLARLKECMETDTWPGVSGESELTFSLPAWAVMESDEPDEPITMGGVALEI